MGLYIYPLVAFHDSDDLGSDYADAEYMTDWFVFVLPSILTLGTTWQRAYLSLRTVRDTNGNNRIISVSDFTNIAQGSTDRETDLAPIFDDSPTGQRMM